MPSCNVCNRSFVDKNALRMHEKSKHECECTYCHRAFRTLEGKYQHERSKHSLECSICNRQFVSNEALEQHKQAKHPPIFECTYCDRAFKFNEARLQHENAKHASRTIGPYSYLSPPSLYMQVPAEEPAVVEQPIINAVLDSSSLGASKLDSSSDEDVVMMQSPKAQVLTPKPAANFACGTCGEHVATIIALEAHELQHKPDTCACTICERADKPCNCVICKRTSTSTSALVDEKVLGCAVSDELEETVVSAVLFGDIEPDVVEEALAVSCDLVMELESQGGTDPSIDHGVPAHGMFARGEQPLLELEREVDGEHSHDLTPTCTPSTPRHKHSSIDDPTWLSEVAMNLTEGCGITNLPLEFAPMECDSIPCDLNVSEQHSALDAHAIVQGSTDMCPSQPDVPLDLTNSPSQDHNMSPPEPSNDQPIVLDMDMSHEQADRPLECDPCVPEVEPDTTSSSQESPGNDTLVSATSTPVQARSPQVCASELEPPAEPIDPSTRNLAPSPTPSEHGSVRPPSITHDDHSHSGSCPLSPSTSEGSAGYFSDADRSSTPSSPLSDHSIVFVSADSIPEYVRENRAYLVATSAPSRPSSTTSSCVPLPSVVTSSDSLPLEQDENAHAEAPPADSPSANGQSPLYCRVCLRDPCDDVTATMCGHIFCNRCIIEAVMARSACPVCTAPTLLYCLFRLDV
ncbi:hypothetical protein P692DRAFT_20831395 [Suillus brevipes Sb2]|nr:hypothetical protein P692DRAFT_20831395 [Suillus brevipes Sb2]